ncbi:MAG: hypothetical protein HFI98_07735 [Lachnospiraceae bacterium]|jgi:flagellar basal body-associated protein FliL|nr:hypothetical protein [Lachnospiraceae bacterium]MCI9202403.1 hypothetical protein [Lachnospiraceae bacterium]MCI9334626.1 hypothetical protein [Lachnospiraceae bacterium]
MTLSREEQIFLLVLIINTVIAVIYFLVGILIMVPVRGRKKKEETERLRDNRRTYLIRFIVMLLCPVFGIVFFFVSHLLFLTIFRRKVDLEDVVFSKERVRTQLKADEDRERNLVPIEEAIVINDNKSLREVMLNTVKGDIKDFLSAISMALDTEDSESAHYAASILSFELDEFRLEVERLYEEIKEEEPGETGAERKLLDYMNVILKQKVFTDLEQKRYVRMMADVAETFFEKNPLEITQEQYENVCLRLMEIREYEKSEKWCLRLSEQYPDQLSSYTCKLKLYFVIKNREAFFQTLDGLKASDVVIDNETLELVRIFS